MRILNKAPIIALFLSLCFSNSDSRCPPGSHNVRYYGNRCTSYDDSLLKTWNDANEQCLASHGKLLRVESRAALSRLTNSIPFTNYINTSSPAAWIGGFTADYSIVNQPTPSSTQTNGTTPAPYNPFRLKPAATWYWADGSNPAPSNSVRISDTLITNSSQATGHCMGASRDAFYAQNCSQPAKFVCEYDCVTNITSSNTSTITSPNYPDSYPADTQCEWHIDVQSGHAILEFESFQLEGSCSYDYLEVKESKGSSNHLSMQCGSTTPGRIESPSQTMYLKFASDGSGQYRGFKGSVRSSTVSIGTAYNDTHGVVTTDDFPDFYDANSARYWTINTGGIVNLRFTDFDLQPGNGTHCIYDSLQIREQSASGRILGTFCGNELPANLSSHTGVLYLSFNSDALTQRTGFRAIYWSSSVPCLRISSAGYGEITTPDYPSSPLYGECVWYIDVLEGVAKIAVEPTTTSTDSSSCTMSQLAVYDARLKGVLSTYEDMPTVSANRLGIYCGSHRPTSLRSGSRYLMVTFSSTSGYRSPTYAKLKAKFRSSTNCSQTVVATNGTGVVTSPEYPNYYDPYSNCSWLIDVEENTTMTLKFNAFSFQSHSTCLYDQFTVYNGDSAAAPKVGTFCGSSMPPLLHSSGRYLYLTMTTDGASQSRGFSAEFWSSGVTCSNWGFTDVVTKNFNNTCFGYLKSAKSWSAARSYCEARNSALVKFDNQAKFNAIKQWIFDELSQNISGVWTAGYRRTSASDIWFWSTLNGDTVIKDGVRSPLWANYRPINTTSYAYISPAGLMDTSYSNHYTLCEEHKPSQDPGQVTASPPGSCSPPPLVRSGSYAPAKDHYKDGDSIKYRCYQMFILVGNETLTCKSGLWLPHAPNCRPPPPNTPTLKPSSLPSSCKPPPSIKFGSYNPTEDLYKHGSKITVKCAAGFTLTDEGEMECKDGQWSGYLSLCVKELVEHEAQVNAPAKSHKSLVAGTVSVIVILLVIIALLIFREVKQRRRNYHSQLLLNMH